MKYIFLGTPDFAATILESLCDQGLPPVAVITQVAKASGRGQKISGSAVEAMAKQKDLNLFATLDVNQEPFLSVLRTFHADVFLVAAFGQIFRDTILSLPRLGCFNVHASLLPLYRGAAPVQRAIWNGDVQTGITIQKMAKRLDAGDILLQRTVDVGHNDTTQTLLRTLSLASGPACKEALEMLEAGKFSLTPQDESKATLAPKIERSHALIDWTRPAAHLRNQIRALQPWPVAETTLQGTRLKIFSAEIESENRAGSPGTIHTDSKRYLSVACGDRRALSLTEVQLENRKRLKIDEFLAAYRGEFPHSKMGP